MIIDAPQHKLPWNIEDETERSKLTAAVQQWITDDNSIHMSEVVLGHDAIEKRLDGDSSPVGFTKDHIGAYAQGQNPTISPEDKANTREFVEVNRTRPNHESILGDFINTRRKLSVGGRTPHDRSRARVLQSIIEFFEDIGLFAETVYMPAMDNSWPKGLAWAELMWDQASNKMKGMCQLEAVNARDVIVDNQTSGHFFANSKRFARRVKIEVEEANRIFKKYTHYKKVTGDTEYDNAYQRSSTRLTSEHATFYRIQVKRREIDYYFVNPETSETEELTEEEFTARMEDPNLSPYLIETPPDTRWYFILYNTSTGVFHVEYNPYGMPTLIPLCNIHSEKWKYGLGDVSIYASLEDLFKVFITVMLENAKRANKPVGQLTEEAWSDEEMRNAAQQALDHGGLAPGLTSIWSPQPINNYLVGLAPQILGWIQDSVSKHSASMGQAPAQQIAKETVNTLIAKDRIAHGRKDVTLTYFLSRIVQLMTKMICYHYKEADYIPLLDMRPGSSDYIPINQRWTETEYISNLAQINKLRIPQLRGEPTEQVVAQFQQENIQFEQQMQIIRDKFEMENDVEVSQENGYQIDGQDVTSETLSEMIQKSGMQPKEFAVKYKVRESPITVFHINDMAEDADLNVKYRIDSDDKNDPQVKMQKGMIVRQNGGSFLDFLRDMDLTDADERYKAAMEENQIMKYGTLIAENPELQQALQVIIQNLKLQGKPVE